jgi:hypothetical protein
MAASSGDNWFHNWDCLIHSSRRAVEPQDISAAFAFDLAFDGDGAIWTDNSI